MAALSPDARGSPSAERFRLLRELRSAAVPAWAALESLASGGTRLVVVERVARGATFSDQAIADWVRDAKCLAALEHPNVARVRDVVIRGDEVLVASEFVDGVRWAELAGSDPAPPLEVGLRMLVDVLSGLSAIHNLRDAKRQPLKLIHGELTPEHVVVGADGVARVVSACRAKAKTTQRSPAAARYLAPEVLLADESADARADVYGVGVMLWETLTGRRLFDGLSASMIVTQLLSGRVPRAAVPEDAAWAAPLVDVVARALSADPAQRFASATALAAELRRVAGGKLPSAPRVAAAVRATFGEAIRLRREALERGEVAARHDVPSDSIEVEIDPVPVSNAPTPVPPPPTASTKPPPPLPAPPAPRPRQPTLAGVAPPVPEAARAKAPSAPVVVPHSSRPPPPAAQPGAPKPSAAKPNVGADPRAREIEKPTPYVPFAPAMLASPPVPEDLVKALGAVAAPQQALELESADAPPLTPVPVVETAKVVIGPPSRRRARVAIVAAAVLVAGVVAIWLLSSSRGGDQTAAAPSPTATATAATTKMASSTATATTTATAMTTTTTIASKTPVPTATAAAAPTAAPDATENSPPAVGGPAASPTPPPAAPRPAARRKYEPEGI